MGMNVLMYSLYICTVLPTYCHSYLVFVTLIHTSYIYFVICMMKKIQAIGLTDIFETVFFIRSKKSIYAVLQGQP